MASLSTKKGGSKNPIAVPMIFATESIANATDLYDIKIFTDSGRNHLTAILVGAFKMKGWAMPQSICPAITK